MNRIVRVDRYGQCTSNYMYFVRYENGDIEQYSSENMPREIFRWMAGADFQFMRSLSRGECFQRFQPHGM